MCSATFFEIVDIVESPTGKTIKQLRLAAPKFGGVSECIPFPHGPVSVQNHTVDSVTSRNAFHSHPKDSRKADSVQINPVRPLAHGNLPSPTASSRIREQEYE